MKYVSPQTEKRKQKQKKRKKQLALCVCLVAFIVAVIALVAVFMGGKDAPDSSSQPNSEVVESLPENTGMIFDFEKPDYYAMWMKNTYVPLDMIFFNDAGVVVALANDREPLSEDYVSPCNLEYEVKASNTPIDVEWDIDGFFDECEARYQKPNKLIRYVIEGPAGTIKANNIGLGDKLSK